MKYNLRSLMIVVLVGPPAMAGALAVAGDFIAGSITVGIVLSTLAVILWLGDS